MLMDSISGYCQFLVSKSAMRGNNMGIRPASKGGVYAP